MGRGARDGILQAPSRTRAPKPDSSDGEHLQGREQAVAAAAPVLVILVVVEAAGRPRLVIKDVHLGVFSIFFAVLVVVVIVAICRAGAGVSGPSGAPSSQLRLQPTQCRFKPSTPGRACRACGEGWVGGMGVRVGGAHRGARSSPRGPPRRRWPAAPMARSGCCLRRALTHLPSRLGSGGPDAVHLRCGTCLVGW